MEAKAKEWFRKENLFPVLSSCLLIFSIPLLVPGLTLTLVAFTDETGFAKYGAIHVLGMVLLCVSGMLFIAGCIVKLFFNKEPARVSPADEEEGIRCTSSGDHSNTASIIHVSTHTSSGNAAAVASTTIIVNRSVSCQSDNSSNNDGEEDEPDDDKVIAPKLKVDSLPPPPVPGLSKRHNVADHLASQSYSSADSSSTSSPVRLPHAGDGTAVRVNAATVARAAQSEQEASDAAAAAQQRMLLLGPAGATGERRTADQPSPTRRGCNFMTADSEDEKREADKYHRVAQTFPKNRAGMIRGMSMVSTASSSFSSAHSLYESFDADQDPADTELILRAQGPGAPKLLKHGAVVSRGCLRQSSTTSREQPSWQDNEEIQLASFKSTHRGSGDLNEDAPDRLFLSREERTGTETQNNDRLSEAERDFRTGDREQESNRATEIRDVSSSSLEKQASSGESPSHGTYSVKSALSEELLYFKESPSGLPDEGEFSQSFLLSERGGETNHRPLTPVPRQSDDNHDAQNAIFSESQDRMAKSNSSIDTTQETKRASSGNNTAFSQGDGEESTPKTDSDVHNAEQGSKRKKKKKKKKKWKQRDQSVIDEDGRCDENHELEAELIRLEQTGRQDLSPLRSIMHSHHHSDHHVHFPDADIIR